jgi:hypothetical protein
MTMPKGYKFVGCHSPNRKSVNGTDASIAYAPYLNKYCAAYKYNGQPLDADEVAAVINTENINWDTNLKSETDYSLTHSLGLGQFTRITRGREGSTGTGQGYGISTDAQARDAELNIKALCMLWVTCLKHESGVARNAYKVYNGGPGYSNTKQMASNQKRYDTALAYWKKYGNGPIGNETPAATNNNTTKLKDEQKKLDQKKASDKAIADKKAVEDKKKADIKAAEVLKQAKLTKDKDAIKKAQAQLDKQKATPAKTTPPIKTTKSDDNSKGNKIVKSGMGIIGVLALAVLFNGYTQGDEML